MAQAKRSMKQLNWRVSVLIALLGTGLVLVAFVLAQQVVRLGANALPATTAAQVSQSVQAGADPSAAAGPPVPSFGEGSGATVIVYDVSLRPIGTNIKGFTDEPSELKYMPPKGTFNYDTSKSVDHRFTWQPTSNLRLATVLVRAGDKGYVVAAQNLHEAEKLENTLAALALAGEAGVLLVAVIALIL